MQETAKYKLKKPEESDYADIAVLNENMDKVEKALGGKPDTTELPTEVKKAVQAGTLTAADLGAVSSADKGKPNGVAELDSQGKVPSAQLPEVKLPPMNFIPVSEKGKPNGVAELGSDGKLKNAQMPVVDCYTKNQTLSAATKTLLGLASGALPDDAFKALHAKTKIVVGSYVGTGTSGESDPNSITFPFAPKYIVILGYTKANAAFVRIESNNDWRDRVFMPSVTTSYVSQNGFGNIHSFGKKSNDGKTFYWYSTGGQGSQLNDQGRTFHYIAVG